MREHMRGCPPCDRHDTMVRRSLLLVRSLPSIEPSPDFRARLDARLREVAASPVAIATPTMSFRTMLPFLATAAAVLAIAAVGTQLFRAPAQPIVMRPVVALTPATGHPSLPGPALVASVPTGMSIWPAIMAASQVPMHLAATEMVDER